MAIDESGLPYVMPASVPRVTADGRPTTHLINWEELTRNWYYTNAVATDKRITEVKAETDEAIARFSEDILTLAEADRALAQRITTLDTKTSQADAQFREDIQSLVEKDTALSQQITDVTAKANNATANGQIKFAAKAAPTGATAAYGIYLTANNTFTGFEMLAMSNGTSAISFTASQFMLRDGGTAQPIFNYSSGLFTFNVPIRVGTNDIGLQAVNAPSAVVGTHDLIIQTTNGQWQTIMSVTATGGPGQVAVVHADFEYKLTGFINSWSTARYRLIRSDGFVLHQADLLGVHDYIDRVFIQRLDASFTQAYTYSLQVNIVLDYYDQSEDPYYRFTYIRGLMVDLRKR